MIVFTDWEGTLVESLSAIDKAWLDFARHYLPHVEPRHVADMGRAIWWRLRRHGSVKWRDVVRQVLRTFGGDADIGEATRFLHTARARHLYIHPDIPEALRGLKKMGWRIYLVTRGHPTEPELRYILIHGSGLGRYIDRIFVVGTPETGYRGKADVVESLLAKPRVATFIDDRPTNLLEVKRRCPSITTIQPTYYTGIHDPSPADYVAGEPLDILEIHRELLYGGAEEQHI